MSAHTPGPWRADAESESGEHWFTIYPEPGEAYESRVGEIRNGADARLCAAAPEMVDALNQAATALNYAFEALAESRCDPCLVSKVSQARGAIGVVLEKALLK